MEEEAQSQRSCQQCRWKQHVCFAAAAAIERHFPQLHLGILQLLLRGVEQRGKRATHAVERVAPPWPHSKLGGRPGREAQHQSRGGAGGGARKDSWLIAFGATNVA